MQTVQMLTDVVGLYGVWREHEVHEIDDNTAQAWKDNGQARAVAIGGAAKTPAAKREKPQPPAGRRERPRPAAAGRETRST